MKERARVYANDGWTSEIMSVGQAISYAFLLRRLGNYGVKVRRCS